MAIQKDLEELVKAEVISEDTAARIRQYYQKGGGTSVNRLFVVFGVLGAILVGLGVILIIAHNWDELSRIVKTAFAFLPLLLGQLLCAFVLVRKKESSSWSESASAFLFFAVGSSISLVSQIYHIPGDISAFMISWMLLSLPLVYLMRSSVVSLLYLIGITYYACQTGYWSRPVEESYLYWLLVAGILPHYYFLLKKRPRSNFTIFHSWLLPISLIICLGTIADSQENLMFVAYFSLFGLLYLIGNEEFFQGQKLRNNGYRVLGSLGSIILLLVLSFDDIWQDLRRTPIELSKAISSAEFISASLISILAGILLFRQIKHHGLKDFKPMAPVFILFMITFFIGNYSGIAVLLINVYIFVIGILIIREGARLDHFGVLNYGLLVITALIICRFFDTHLSFVVRGLLFVSIGVGFFLANYWMLRKRRGNG